MAQTGNEEYLNDNSKLESKVVRALARIEKKSEQSKKMKKKAGVAPKQIVKYLKANYCGLDGDLDSQVMTALLQCVKTGLVCALDGGRYLLLGPKTRTMIASCFARAVHGDGCFCMKKVPCPSPCCMVNVRIDNQVASKGRKSRRKGSESPEVDTKSDKAETILCDYCFEIHPVPEKSPKKKCIVPLQKTFTAPFDTFSPRDELNFNKAAIKVRKK